MTAIQIIADSSKDAGIKITPAYPDFNALVEERNTGKFELVINNEKQLGNTPYNVLRLPLPPTAPGAADEWPTSRASDSARSWTLTQQLNKILSSNVIEGEGDPFPAPEE